MNNLKRVLCLSLAVVMIVGMMVVGTSAANFTDSSAIVNTEAVNTMSALNIINGKGDGSYFDPPGSSPAARCQDDLRRPQRRPRSSARLHRLHLTYTVATGCRVH